jgi:integrase
MTVLNKLSVKEIEAIHKQKKVGKHADGGGLFLHVTEAGGFYWRYKYRLNVNGVFKERLFALGTYPEVKLADAREKHLAARKLVDVGIDPVHSKRQLKAERAANRPFSEVALEWWDELIEPHHGKLSARREKYNIETMDAAFGTKLITEVTLSDLSDVLAKYQRAGKHETRRRIQQTAIKIGGFAVGRGYLKDRPNPFLGVQFTAAFTSPESVREHRPAITDPRDFGRLLTDIDERATDIMGRALRMLALTMVRPGELAQQVWRNIKWDDAKMIIPAEFQKMRTQRKRKNDPPAGKEFEVPLSRQALAELKALWKLTGKTPYLFPAQQRKNKRDYVREASINDALNEIDYQGIHCAHGFRSSASTMLNEERMIVEGKKVLRWPDQKALIEVQLDHNDASTQAVYDRGGRWEERCELMQLWADRIDEMRGSRVKLREAA